MLNILRDIRSGWLPLEKVPEFLIWLLAQSFWFWFALLAAGLAVLSVVR